MKEKYPSTFLDARKVAKETWLKIFCYKFSSIPLLGKQLATLKQFPSLPFHSTEFILRKIFKAVKYEPNKGKQHFPLTLRAS
jgi:hypothetical protein